MTPWQLWSLCPKTAGHLRAGKSQAQARRCETTRLSVQEQRPSNIPFIH